MSALVLDAGALMAAERVDRHVVLQIRVARSHGQTLRTNAMVVAQVWRGGRDRQAGLAALLHAVDVVAVTDELGRATGALLGRAGTGDAIDASLVLIAADGDRILTSDPDEIGHLVSTTRRAVTVIRC